VLRGGGRSSVSGVVASVFGATGFMGRYVVNRLGWIGSQVVVPYRGDGMNTRNLKQMGDYGQIVPLPCDLHDADSVRRAVSRSNVVINLIGSQFQSKNYSYHDVHVKAAYRIAKISKEAGVNKFIQISTVNADTKSESKWIATKAEGEEAVRSVFPSATILRCATVYGEEDNFLNRYAIMTNVMPFVPLLNKGLTRLQPIWVHDVAQAVLNSITFPEAVAQTYEIGGANVYTFSTLIQMIAKECVMPSNVVEVPEAVAKLYGLVCEAIPQRFRPLTKDQVIQMKYDMVVPTGQKVLTLADLQIPAHDLGVHLGYMIQRHRRTREPLDAPQPHPFTQR